MMENHVDTARYPIIPAVSGLLRGNKLKFVIIIGASWGQFQLLFAYASSYLFDVRVFNSFAASNSFSSSNLTTLTEVVWQSHSV